MDQQITDKDRMTFLTTEEAAEYLKITPRMLAARRRAGKLSCYKDGKVILFTVAHLKSYLMAFEEPAGHRKYPRQKSRSDVTPGPTSEVQHAEQSENKVPPKSPAKAPKWRPGTLITMPIDPSLLKTEPKD